MEHLRCVVERITYQNAENGYTVLKCAVKGEKGLLRRRFRMTESRPR